jgi:Uma2 family endonuclease
MGALKLEDIPRYTYDDYKLWDDKWELIYGVAYAMSPAPIIKHQTISANITSQLKQTFSNCRRCQVLLPVDWKIDDETIVQPDNSVICHIPKHEAYISKAPKIIFEILSKSTAKKDKTIKFDLYEKEGVNYYIIVDPKDEVAKVYKLKDGKYIKMCDATDEKIKFEFKECKSIKEFDFAKIW